jgi:hypothetical protein
LLFCELADGTRGALPSWMTDPAACATLRVGPPQVTIAALQELRVLLDALDADVGRAPDASMPFEEGCDAPKGPSIPTQIPLFRPGHERRVELAARSSRSRSERWPASRSPRPTTSVTAKGAEHDDR